MSAWNPSTSFGRSNRTGKPSTSRGGLIVVCVFLTPFFVVGAAFLVLGLRKVVQGEPGEGWPMSGVAIVFLTVASGFLALVLHGFRKSRRDAEVAAANPSAPWLWRKDWAAGTARSNRRASVIAMWLFAIFWNGVSSPIFFVFRQEWEKGNKAVLIALLFPLVGIGLLAAAIRLTLQWRRFGQSVLHLETLPGCLGQHFQARLEIPCVMVTIQEIRLKLTCVRRTTTGSGKNRSTREDLLWEETRVVPHRAIALSNAGLSLPVFFPLPDDQPESLDGNPAIVWRLKAHADLPGVDYAETFEVPVFRSRDTVPKERVTDPLAEFQASPDVGSEPVMKGVRIRETAVGVSIDFLPGRNNGSTFGLIVFTAVWTGILYFLLQVDMPRLFPFMWGAFNLILLAGVLSALFYGVRVTTEDRHLTIRHRLILPTVTRSLPPGSVRAVTAQPGMRSGSTQFYKVVVEDHAGHKFHAGGGIREKRDAVWIAERLAMAVGL
ncbi:MAG: hypothetical protein R3F07_17705 [Opitutaceae bacterium]